MSLRPDEKSVFNQKLYWREKLYDNLIETSILPDYQRPAQWSSSEIKFLQFEIPEIVYSQLDAMTNNSDLTLFCALSAVVTVFLHKYTKSSQLIFGIPAYDLEQGKFAQLIPLLIQLSDDCSFKEILLLSRSQICEAYSNQQISYSEIVELVNAPKYDNRCSIFDIYTALTNIHGRINQAEYKADLGFIFTRTEGLITGQISYNAALYSETLIEYYIRHLNTLFVGIIQDINAKIDSVSLLDEAGYSKIFDNFNRKQIFPSRNKTIVSIFEEQVAANRVQIAVEHNGVTATYQELNQEANKLARLLASLGIKKGKYVAILEERSINFLVAMLAVLKTGAAFIPVDPIYPENRIHYMICNSEVTEIITSSGFLQNVQRAIADTDAIPRTIICFDELESDEKAVFKGKNLNIVDKAELAIVSGENPGYQLAPDNPAYMIYTSGSTGLPKGAINRHDGVLNHIAAELYNMQLESSINFLQSAPTSTDISIWQFFTGILVGGQTTIIDYNDFCSPDILFEFLEINKITVFEIVPSLLKIFIDYLKEIPEERLKLSFLKCLIVTGEVVPVPLVNQWLALFPEIKLANTYGPTEASDDITLQIFDKPLNDRMLRVPIGRPLENLTLYVFDAGMNLMPIGIPGEIGVSGIGVGDGYWKNEEKTQISFIPNPFLPERGATIYRTGDVGRWLPDGTIDFLGRKDHQVKIRGYRIELEEVRFQLLQCENIQDAVAADREGPNGERCLCAYVIFKDRTAEDQFSSFDLKKTLRTKLPDYMIPQYIMQIDEIPLTPNGKVDRKSLPAPQIEMTREIVKPGNEIEEKLISIWSEALNIDSQLIGVETNFFDLGGNSISIIVVKSKIMKEFARNISVIDMFRLVCIRDIAAYLTQEIDHSQILSEEMFADSINVLDETLSLLEED